jgi:hypothetical protein
MDVMKNIIPNGTKIRIIGTEITAVICGCCVFGIETPSVEYKIIHWISGERRDLWVHDWEVEIYEDRKKKAGFVNYETTIIKK